MRRLALPLLLSAFFAGCVSVAPMPDPRGALKPGQRLVVNVYVAPGPWIIDAADSKAEAAAKISPVGFLMQTVQDEHTLNVSKDLQQYMPRPHYGDEFQEPLLKELRLRISSGSVQTGLEAGIVPAQLSDWNKSKDQLDWRAHYYFPDPDAPAPRDYARILTLDDALILDLNVSFGTTASEDGRLMPEMSAASRVYRGDTTHLLWEHEDEVTDQTSSTTLTEFKLSPADLTNRLQALAPQLAKASAGSFLKAFGLAAPPALPVSSATFAGSSTTARGFSSGGGGGLVPMSFFQNMPQGPLGVAASTTPVITLVQSTAPVTGAAVSTSIVAGVAVSTSLVSGVAPSSVPVFGVAPSSPAAIVVVSSGMTAVGTIPVSVSTPPAAAPAAP
ncbi:MAG: hypothetical protein ACHQ51_12015 [Elusimicrobiota bacterium]